MAAVNSLREIADAIDSLSDDWEAYLDPDTGEIVMGTDEMRRLVEKGAIEDELPEWQRELLPKVRAAIESDRFLLMPDRSEVHEWAIMERFSRAQEDEPAQRELLGAIHGSGAFRKFRSALQRLNLEDAWYRLRQSALEEIAREWLEEHHRPYK
jgi:hypothetical protein